MRPSTSRKILDLENCSGWILTSSGGRFGWKAGIATIPGTVDALHQRARPATNASSIRYYCITSHLLGLGAGETWHAPRSRSATMHALIIEGETLIATAI